LDSLLMRIPLF